MYRAGFLTGFVALAILEVLTGFQGPAFFNMTAALGAMYTVWFATDAFGRHEALEVQAGQS
jgi:hypothetical protein